MRTYLVYERHYRTGGHRWVARPLTARLSSRVVLPVYYVRAETATAALAQEMARQEELRRRSTRHEPKMRTQR